MLELQTTGAVATLTLDRPEVLNALSGELIAALLQRLAQLSSDDTVRAIVLTGRGRAFCAGADLSDPMMNTQAPPDVRAERFLASADAGIHALARALAGLRKPLVAAVNGAAVGGGAALALSAHVTLAAETAYLQQPFTAQLGLAPDMGASWQLMRRLGPGRALPLAMLGERLGAREAADWGLIWRCVPDGELAAAAADVAGRLAAGAPAALAALPALMADALTNGLDAQLDRERDAQAALVRTQDFIEAVTAFREKRKPRFCGH
ncbi:enoyl-CoA hydratase-related protein [Xenophilus aerolatus]|nr:enoyl-CoA hydratase-related protein [Xenophilus aerolatus]